MTTCRQWAELDRTTLRDLLPGAVVVLSVGAVEQHGDHLPTGTDALLSQEICRRAADVAGAQGTEMIIAPPLWVGASEHHLPYGGTLSLRVETFVAVLIDLLTSMATSGARRIVIVNGHGGNSGACHAAASAVAARHEVEVAHVDYWQLVDRADTATMPVPGHAGAFETSLIMAVRPELVGIPTTREAPPDQPPSALTVHGPDVWRRLDGWTDRPADADAGTGRTVLTGVVEALGRALVDRAPVDQHPVDQHLADGPVVEREDR